MKKAICFLYASLLLVCLTACAAQEIVQDYSINDPEMIYNSSLLNRAKTIKIGNNSNMDNLARSLAAGAFVDHIQLYTKEKPYGIEITYKEFNEDEIQPTSDIKEYEKYYGSMFSSDQSFKRNMFYNSVVIFALVENADFVKGVIGDKSFTLKRSQVEKFLNKKCSYYMNNKNTFYTEITALLTNGSSELDAFLNGIPLN